MADSTKEYRIRQVEFLGKKRHVVYQIPGELSPLVEVANVILLRENLPEGVIFENKAGGKKYIQKRMLEAVVYTSLIVRLNSLVKSGQYTQSVMDSAIPGLQGSIPLLYSRFAVYQNNFTSTSDFMDTAEKVLCDCLGIRIYHGGLVEPQDTNTNLCNENSMRLQLEVVNWETKSEGDADRISLIKNFLDSHQFTLYGLAQLYKDVPEGVLSLFLKAEVISVLYKHKGTLNVLATSEEEVKNYPDAMWKKLENVDGDGDHLTSTFGPINVNWREKQEIIIEAESRAEKKKETRRLKKLKKKQKAKTQDESAESSIDLVDEPEPNIAEDKGPVSPSPQDGGLGSSGERLKDRFMQFLKEYQLEGKPYFRHQFESMLATKFFCLIICYGWIKTYDKDLAVCICSDYYRAGDDLRQYVCDYFCSIIQENSVIQGKTVSIDEVELYMKMKLKICRLPAQQKRVMSFKEFAEDNCMYIVYELDGTFVNSTSYVGRMAALGYLKFILQIHKSGFSWNGQFDISLMYVKIVKGIMIFKIRIIAAMVTLTKDSGIADFKKYAEILFPFFKRSDVEGYPAYFDRFMEDFLAMPDPQDSVQYDKFQKYMGAHLFAKAPLVRSGLITNTYRVCDSLIVTHPAAGWTVYAPLDVKNKELPEWSKYQMSTALGIVYHYKDPLGTGASSNMFDKKTYWCVLSLGRHAVQHLHWHTKQGNKQTIQDLVIVDLTLGHDLKGVMAKVVRFIIQINNFDGPFSSVWRTFMASETFDEPAKDAAVAVGEDGETETGATAPIAEMSSSATDTARALATAAISGSAPAAQPPPAPLQLQCKMQGHVVNLSCNDISCLEDGRSLFDSIIDYVYACLSLGIASQNDILLMRPVNAYLIGNLQHQHEVEFHTQSLDLKSRRMVFVPVNDNTDYMRADRGMHWSLLIIHIAEDRSSCRIVHHDSMAGLNYSVAVKYANALKHVLPKASPVVDADTPRQQFGSDDCGLCVLALTKAICKWWNRSGRTGKSNCWVEEINSKITGATYAAMRVQLKQDLMVQMQDLTLATATAAALDLTTDTAAAPALATGTVSGSGPCTAPAAQPPAYPLKLKCKMQDKVVELFCKDLSCLEDGSYLDDSIINFVYAQISLIFRIQEDLLLVPPMHTFPMVGDMKTEAEVEAEAKSLDLKSRRMVLVPVNGNMRADGGRHWSLLVIQVAEDRSSCSFVHHDFSDGFNRNAADEYANVFRRVLPKAPPVIQVLSPWKSNASDYGLCVLALTKTICTWWEKSGGSGISSSWYNEVNSEDSGPNFAVVRVKLRQNLMEGMQALSL